MNFAKWMTACLFLFMGAQALVAGDTNNPSGYDDRTMTYKGDAKLDARIIALSRQVETEPTNYAAIYNLAIAYRVRGNFGQSLILLNRYIEHNPTNDMAYKYRGTVHNILGNSTDAITDFNRGIELNSADGWAFTCRGAAYESIKEYSNALTDYTRALKIDPNYDEALNELAWFRATCPVASFRDPKEAVIVAIKACEATKWEHWTYVDTLGAAYAADGDFTNAIKYEAMATKMDGISKNDLNGLNDRLALFEKHQAYIDK